MEGAGTSCHFLFHKHESERVGHTVRVENSVGLEHVIASGACCGSRQSSEDRACSEGWGMQ